MCLCLYPERKTIIVETEKFSVYFSQTKYTQLGATVKTKQTKELFPLPNYIATFPICIAHSLPDPVLSGNWDLLILCVIFLEVARVTSSSNAIANAAAWQSGLYTVVYSPQ